MLRVGFIGPYPPAELNALEPAKFSTYGRQAIENSKMYEFLYDQGSFMEKYLQGLESADIRDKIVDSIGKAVVFIMDGVLEIHAERDSQNRAISEMLPPILPHELIKLRGKEFSNILAIHQYRLQTFWDEDIINKLEQEFQQLRDRYYFDKSL
jgi:hypothetical protein